MRRSGTKWEEDDRRSSKTVAMARDEKCRKDTTDIMHWLYPLFPPSKRFRIIPSWLREDRSARHLLTYAYPFRLLLSGWSQVQSLRSIGNHHHWDQIIIKKIADWLFGTAWVMFWEWAIPRFVPVRPMEIRVQLLQLNLAVRYSTISSAVTTYHAEN